MRTYASNSPEAAARLLALTIISDGNLAQSELTALHRSRILQHVALDEERFQQVLHDLCHDLLHTNKQGLVELEPAMIDRLLLEIDDMDLRRRLMQAMWRIADADDWLADAEAVLLNRASLVWGAETNFRSAAERARPRQ